MLEEIHAIGFPLLLWRIAAVVTLEKEASDIAEEYTFNFQIRNNARVISNQVILANFNGRPRNRLIMNVQGLPVNEAGSIIIELKKDDVVVLSATVNVKLPEKPDIKVTN